MKQYKVIVGAFADFIEDKMNDAAKEGFEFESVAVGPSSTVAVMSKNVPQPVRWPPISIKAQEVVVVGEKS